MNHGSRSTYVMGCRCDECKTADSRYKQKYRQKNRAAILAREAEYRKTIPQERKDQYHARYREKHRDRIRQSHAEWVEANREATREHQRRYWLANRESARESERRYRARRASATIIGFTVAQLQGRWDYYAGKCWMCGDPAAHMDHVKPLAKGGPHALSNLRPACGPCNWSKSARWPLPATRPKT